MTIVYNNGIGGSTGDSLALASPLTISGNVWYVDSATGTNAASPAGKNREKPLATIAQAITNSAHDDIIVCLDGHTETLTAGQEITKRLTIVGEGSSSGLPTVTFGNNQASGALSYTFSPTTTNVVFRNIKFAANTQANTTARVLCSASNSAEFIGCYFPSGQYDTGPAVQLASGLQYIRFSGCTFISTATATSAQPESAIKSAGAISDIYIGDTSFSGGTVGYSNFYAVDLSAGAVSRIRGEGISLLLGADVKLHASSTGYFNVQTSTGGSRVDW